jgi:PKD domain-containing protein
MAASDLLRTARHHGHEQLRHPRRLGALIAVALVLGAAPPAAAEPGVLLHLSGGGDRFFDADELTRLRDIPPTDYLLRAGPGDAGQTVTLSGTSVRRVVSSAYPIDQAGFVRFVRADGTWATLTRDELDDPSPFQGGLFPLVFVDSVGTRYFRPVRGDGDANARDNLSTRSGNPLEGWVQTGRVLSVSADADPGQADPGEAVTFRATAAGALAGEQLSIRWSFGDGASATGSSVTHSYGSQGAYDALATVTGSRDSGGTSDLVRVRVGDGQRAPGPGAPSGEQNPNGPGGGPSEGGPNGKPGGAGGNGDGSGDGKPGGSPDREPANSTPEPASPTGSAEAVQAAPTPGTPAQDSTRAGNGRRDEPGSTTAGGQLVRGLLLAARGAPSTVEQQRVAPAAAAAAKIGDAHPLALPLGSATLLALMALGAWREATWVRGRGSR